jgi:UDP-N-acetylglucosamine:LPS N-acetylglucosamine transferase
MSESQNFRISELRISKSEKITKSPFLARTRTESRQVMREFVPDLRARSFWWVTRPPSIHFSVLVLKKLLIRCQNLRISESQNLRISKSEKITKSPFSARTRTESRQVMREFVPDLRARSFWWVTRPPSIHFSVLVLKKLLIRCQNLRISESQNSESQKVEKKIKKRCKKDEKTGFWWISRNSRTGQI